MNTIFNIDPTLYQYVVLPILVFLARILDVTTGTVRIMLVARGKKILSPILGFIEMLIWILVIRQVVLSISNWVCYIAFALGFAAGNYIGMKIEEKLAMGMEVVRIITKKDANDLIEYLKAHGYGVTSIDAQGTMGKVNVIFTVIHRSDLKKVVSIIKRFNPKAFYSVEDVKLASEGVFPERQGFLDSILASKK